MDILLPGSELLNNNRTDKRVVFHRKAQLALASGANLPVKTIDISPGGVGIICPHPIQERQSCSVKVDMIIPDMPDLFLKGLSTYCILSGLQGFRVGIKFQDMEAAMTAQVKKLLAMFAI
jgi:c-di-GMP-binding flagellar brake protein YcgR